MANYRGLSSKVEENKIEPSVQLKGLDYALSQVRQFHKTFGHPAPTRPAMLTPERTEFRHRILLEEVDEFLESKELIDQIDANIDAIYIALGNLVELGVQEVQPFFDIVQNANMSKLGPDGKPIYRESDGKILKPEGWVAPEPLLALELKRQSQGVVSK